VPVIVVEVMPKAELLDPQGKAVAGALARTGSLFSGVRIGKRFELTYGSSSGSSASSAADDDAALAEARELAEHLLSNSVIEDVVDVRVEPDASAGGPSDASASPSPDASAGSSGAAPVDSGRVEDVRSVRGHFATSDGDA